MRHDNHDEDEHDLGFSHDLPRLIGRRRMLALLGGVGVTAMSGLPAAALHCVAIPLETEGPFPADGTNVRAGQLVNALTQSGVIREDLRTSFAGLTESADGIRLDLELTLLRADGCTPLSGHAIYIWHCDQLGRYSLYDTPNANHLRGVGIANDTGLVRFTTIFPGCYPNRWPHIHFEVFESAEAAVSGEASLLTAQIAFPEAECAEVYAGDARYANGTRNLATITLARDSIFRDNSPDELAQQMLTLSGNVADGYAGAVTIPVAMR